MNFPLLTAVLRSDLPCPQRMILTILLNHADKQGDAWPSHATIARQAGLAERSVWGHMKRLEKGGWLTRTGNVGRVGVFSVALPANAAPSVPQELRDVSQAIPQILHPHPANGAGHLANPAALSRKDCGLTTHETPIKYPMNHPEEEDKPPHEVRRAVTVSKKEDWREWNRRQASEANLLACPQNLPEEFKEAWGRYCDYRTRRATQARIASQAIPWSVDGAAAALRSCERHAQTHGWPAVIAQIDTAIGGHWQGLNFHRSSPPLQPRATPTAAVSGPPSALQSEMGTWFGRHAGAFWSADEQAAWADIPQPIDASSDDWLALRWFYNLETGRKYRKQSVLALLRAWTTEIDRAKNHEPDGP